MIGLALRFPAHFIHRAECQINLSTMVPYHRHPSQNPMAISANGAMAILILVLATKTVTVASPTSSSPSIAEATSRMYHLSFSTTVNEAGVTSCHVFSGPSFSMRKEQGFTKPLARHASFDQLWYLYAIQSVELKVIVSYRIPSQFFCSKTSQTFSAVSWPYPSQAAITPAHTHTRTHDQLISFSCLSSIKWTNSKLNPWCPTLLSTY